MGCPTEITINENLAFSIYTHDPDTGAITAADAAPSYWVTDDADTAIVNGTMGNGARVGSYKKKLSITTANGYEGGKVYTIYVEATVNADTGGITYEFKVVGVRTITAPGDPTLCTVQFRVKLSAIPVSGAVCKARLIGVNQAADGTILSNAESSATTDAAGIAELQLVQKGSIAKGSGIYKIWVEIAGQPVASVETTIPNQNVVLFEDLLEA